ncbi:bacterioferritin-associated ferredoxin [Biostraticola tofi]|uniref:Bacterioferritin-associated ferredoxin n=1 Tax=Biostraticola tofi TaxID=466109 RepID=A0A4R3YFJ3_9GAMM|nr:bacterioferritin-associated ferredoxin [Biostraticola tofi]TCV91325.1 bacterioferritin-associated ferredoxin [Biostraticola tofi]
MYVCLCNAVSDKTIRSTVQRFQPQSIRELKCLVPVGNKCGKCIRVAREILEDELNRVPLYEEIA